MTTRPTVWLGSNRSSCSSSGRGTASPTFVLDAATAAPVAEICRRLDGIPLALELAAVRVVHLSVAQLAARLGDALAVLSRRGRGHPDRQQTLAATLDWSHDLLLDDERVAFRRLAVFAGGFDLDAAATRHGDRRRRRRAQSSRRQVAGDGGDDGRGRPLPLARGGAAIRRGSAPWCR